MDRWQEADQEIDRLQRELQVQANSKFETLKRYLLNLKVILKKKAIFIFIDLDIVLVIILYDCAFTEKQCMMKWIFKIFF